MWLVKTLVVTTATVSLWEIYSRLITDWGGWWCLSRWPSPAQRGVSSPYFHSTDHNWLRYIIIIINISQFPQLGRRKPASSSCTIDLSSLANSDIPARLLNFLDLECDSQLSELCSIVFLCLRHRGDITELWTLRTEDLHKYSLLASLSSLRTIIGDWTTGGGVADYSLQSECETGYHWVSLGISGHGYLVLSLSLGENWELSVMLAAGRTRLCRNCRNSTWLYTAGPVIMTPRCTIATTTTTSTTTTHVDDMTDIQ